MIVPFDARRSARSRRRNQAARAFHVRTREIGQNRTLHRVATEHYIRKVKMCVAP